jgi:hypothetical protein
MRSIVTTLALAALLPCVSSYGADGRIDWRARPVLEMTRVEKPARVCGPRGCRTRFFRCPDRISCAPLYGAYGPYGGVRYWSAFSPYP